MQKVAERPVGVIGRAHNLPHEIIEFSGVDLVVLAVTEFKVGDGQRPEL